MFLKAWPTSQIWQMSRFHPCSICDNNEGALLRLFLVLYVCIYINRGFVVTPIIWRGYEKVRVMQSLGADCHSPGRGISEVIQRFWTSEGGSRHIYNSIFRWFNMAMVRTQRPRGGHQAKVFLSQPQQIFKIWNRPRNIKFVCRKNCLFSTFVELCVSTKHCMWFEWVVTSIRHAFTQPHTSNKHNHILLLDCRQSFSGHPRDEEVPLRKD